MWRARKSFQRVMFDDVPVFAHRHAAIVVGEFFEHLTAKVVKGQRICVEEDAGQNPDVVTPDGREFESKAAGYARWLIREQQVERMASTPGSAFVFWRYAYSREKLIKLCKTKFQIVANIASRVQYGCMISASLVSELLTPNRRYAYDERYYVELKGERLLEMAKRKGEEFAAPTAERSSKRMKNVQAMGQRVVAFPMYRVLDGKPVDSVVVPF